MKDRIGILDVGIFVWDDTAFKANPTGYFKLAGPATRFLSRLSNDRQAVVFSRELQAAIYSSFPANGLTEPVLKVYKAALLRFLSTVNILLSEPPNTVRTIDSVPEIQRAHFNDPTRREIERIKTGILDAGESLFTFFSFLFLWPDGNEIRFTENSDVVRVEVVLADFDETLEDYFDRNMRIFDEDHDKHLRLESYGSGGKKVSVLSCYEGRNVKQCQELLNKAVPYNHPGDRLLAWDCENETWVVFHRSGGGELDYRGNNKYHGFDEAAPINISAEALALREECQAVQRVQQ